jgi:site-specific recombinase XerD
VSLRKVEQWQVSWRDGRRQRSRKFDEKARAARLAGEVERERGDRVNIRKVAQWEVRWREGGRDSRRRQRTFDRKADAETFEREVKRRKQLGELATWEKRNQTVRELGREWWANYAVPNLAEWTLTGYEPMLVKHIERRLGGLRVGEVSPEIVADFRTRLEAAGVGRHSVRLSLVVLQAMFKQAVAWGWVQTNPVKAVPKPSGKRERAVVCLAPSQVEAIRAALLAKEKLYAATLVSLVAYQGLRVPEEVLALEVKHVRAKTLLVEQRNIAGMIVAGQKVRGFHPRAVDWVEPARRDVTEYLLALGLRSGPLFPRADGEPWKLHDYKNWSPGLAPCRQGGEHRIRQGGREGQELGDPSLRPAARVRLAPDSGRPVDPRAGRADGPLAADDPRHLRARDSRAEGPPAGVRRGPDRAGARSSWTPGGRFNASLAVVSGRGMCRFAAMARPRIELGTPRFSVVCSTD